MSTHEGEQKVELAGAYYVIGDGDAEYLPEMTEAQFNSFRKIREEFIKNWNKPSLTAQWAKLEESSGPRYTPQGLLILETDRKVETDAT